QIEFDGTEGKMRMVVARPDLVRRYSARDGFGKGNAAIDEAPVVPAFDCDGPACGFDGESFLFKVNAVYDEANREVAGPGCHQTRCRIDCRGTVAVVLPIRGTLAPACQGDEEDGGYQEFHMAIDVIMAPTEARNIHRMSLCRFRGHVVLRRAGRQGRRRPRRDSYWRYASEHDR